MSGDIPLNIFSGDSSALSADWQSFLATPDVDCEVTITTVVPGSGPSASYPGLSCVNNRLWGITFDTSENNTRFKQVDYDVSGKAILGLSTQSVNPQNGLGVVLEQFGVTADQYSDGGVVSQIINTITTSFVLNIDTTEMRSAMWLTPGQALQVDTELSFSPNISSALDAITKAIYTTFGLPGTPGNPLPQLQSPQILLQRTSIGFPTTAADGSPSWNIHNSYTLTFKFAAFGFLFWITLQPDGTSLSLTEDPSTQYDLWSKLDGLGGSGLSSSTSKPVFEQLLDDVSLLSLSVTEDANNKFWWQVTAAVLLKKGNSSTDPPVQIYLSYDSQSETFSGGLMLSNFYATPAAKLLPNYQPWRDLEPPAGITLPDYYDLAWFFPEIDSLPVGLPTAIATATITYQKADPSTLWISAILIAPPDQTSFVPCPFVWDELDIQVTKGVNFSCSLGAQFTLNPREGDPYPAAALGIVVGYNGGAAGAGGSWLLSAYATNLSFGLLYGYFDSKWSDQLVSILGKLNIASLQLLYTYAPSATDSRGSASSFIFTGIITLGALELRLFYQYASFQAGTNTAAQHVLTNPDDPQPVTATQQEGTTWRFECDLGASGPNATVGTIISSIVDDASGLPPFVANIPIPSAEGRSPISMQIEKTDDMLLFAFRITIEMFTLTFIQVANQIDKDKTPKRLLRFAVDKIPLIGNIPLIDKLPQPFDQMEYMWMNDTGGLVQSEVEALNAQILTGEDALQYKKIVADKTTDAEKAQNVVILPGHHFVVISNKEVVIDHVFQASNTDPVPTPAPAPTPALVPSALVTRDTSMVVKKATATDPTPTSNPPSKGALSFSVGPLSISAVTLQYKEQGTDKYLYITMDATFAMGPLSFSLLGFSIGLPLDSVTLDNLSGLIKNPPELSDLSGIVANTVQLSLNGLALTFSNPPLLIAGIFEHQIIGTGANRQEIYLGGIGVSSPPYTFIGLGEYAILSNYKSVFIYCKLDGRK